MHFRDYSYHEFFCSFDKPFCNLQECLADLKGQFSQAYFKSLANNSARIVLAIHYSAGDEWRQIMANCGFVLAQYGMYPESVKCYVIRTDNGPDLTNPFCFSETAMF